MKLRFRAILKTIWWPAWDNASDFPIDIKDIRVNFKLSEKQEEGKSFLSFPIEIDIPIKDEEICKTRLDTPLETPNGRQEFELNPYADQKSLQRAHIIAAYVADVLQDQTHYCVLLEITPVSYIPETEEDQKLLESSIVQQQREAVFPFRVGDIDIESIKQSFQRSWRHREFLHIKAHAMRLNDPISKYRELYRALEYALKHLSSVEVKDKLKDKLGEDEKKKKLKKPDLVLSILTGKKPEYYRDLRDLRDKCSHAFEDFITHSDLEGLEKIEEALPKLEEVVEELEKKLLDTEVKR